MKFVEENGGNAAQCRVVNHLPQQHAFGDETDFGAGGGAVLEADLVADLLAQFHAEFVGHAGGEQPGGEPAWLEHHDLAVAGEAVLEDHLRHLGGFAGAGGRGQDQPLVGLQAVNDVVFNFVNR